VDLCQKERVFKLTAGFKPDCVLHLAAFSSAGESLHRPYEALYTNYLITLNLLEALRVSEHGVKAILYVSSSDIYAASENPITEDSAIATTNPYAVSKIQGEQVCHLYHELYNMPIIIARPFNHTGKGQDERFFIPSMIRQISDVHESEGSIHVGNLEIQREFLDVRDVCDAYFLLLQKGSPGEIYNVCRGETYYLRAILESISKLMKKNVKIKIDEERYRPNEKPRVIGDYSKLARLGWRPAYSLEDTLISMISR
jgi:GDP-4-dehydro-6-deoxy-D-mannose reductase